MRLKTVFASFLVMACLFAGDVVLAKDFSADFVNTTKSGVFEGKIYGKSDRFRMETPQGIVITRVDKSTVWMLMPSELMYMEQAFDPRNINTIEDKMPGEIERALVGKETLGGRSTTKYRITYELAGVKSSIFQWIDEGLGVPIKSAALDDSWSMEYKNIKMDPQPDSLFEIPPGYKKFSYEMPQSDNKFPVGEAPENQEE